MRRTSARLAAVLLALALGGGQAAAQGAFGLAGDEPVEIESDRLEVLDNDGIAIFTGNVVLVQGGLLLRAVKLTVYYTQEKGEAQGAAAAPASADGAGATGSGAPRSGMLGGTEIERMLAEGKVFLDQSGQVVTGDRGEFNMKSGDMVVTGKEVVLTEGPNIVVGCRFTKNSDSGLSQVDSCPNSDATGRVKMLLQPGSTPPG